MRLSTRWRPARLVAVLALLWAARGVAAPPPDVTAAARAFEEGQRAQLRGDYATAAELFELADRTIPSAQALRSAIRNFEAAGNAAHAVTLALSASDRYPADSDTRKLVDSIVARLAPKLGHLVTRCAPDCTLAVDARITGELPQERHEVYLAPGEHELTARYADGRSETRRVQLGAGDSQELALHLEAAPAAPAVVATTATAQPKRDRRLAPIWTVVGAGATVALTAALIWSGSDTLSARDRYAAMPTEAGYHDGTSREARTNGLIAATVVLGAGTAALAIFGTRWHGSFTGSGARHETAAGSASSTAMGPSGAAGSAGRSGETVSTRDATRQ